MPSNWRQAIGELLCPKCGAWNRPGATIIEIEDGVAKCACCGHAWVPQRP